MNDKEKLRRIEKYCRDMWYKAPEVRPPLEVFNAYILDILEGKK